MSDCACPVIVTTVEAPIAAVVGGEPTPIAAIVGNSERVVLPNQVQATAGETIPNFAAVYVASDLAFLADNSDLANFDKFAGIAMSGGIAGTQLTITTEGFVQNPAWNWTNGLVWLGNGGLLTQVSPVPSPGIYRQFVGIAISPVKLILRISEPILYNI